MGSKRIPYTKSPFQVIRNGRRYWAHRIGDRWNFWSDHNWPFYHGHFDTDSREEALKMFREWIPACI